VTTSNYLQFVDGDHIKPFEMLFQSEIICHIYVGILRHMRRHQAPTTPSMTSISAVSSSYNLAVARTGTRSRRDEKKRQVGRTLVLVIVMFAVLWLPVHIHLLVMYFGEVPQTRFYEVNTISQVRFVLL